MNYADSLDCFKFIPVAKKHFCGYVMQKQKKERKKEREMHLLWFPVNLNIFQFF